MMKKITVIAQLELFAGKNMRQSFFTSSYRPIFEFINAETKISGKIDLINTDKFFPGEKDLVQITFLKGLISDHFFNKGSSFNISEGGLHNLGKGKIIEIK